MLYRKHHDAVLKLVQPVLLAPILQRVEIGHEHFPSFIVVISSASRANPAFPEKRLTPRALVRRAEGRRRRPGAPFECALKIAFMPSRRPEIATGTRESAAHRESTGRAGEANGEFVR